MPGQVGGGKGKKKKLIRAVYVSAHAEDFQCGDKCKYWHHCNTNNPSPIPLWEIDGKKLTTCPRGNVTYEAHELLRWYTHYKNNILPVAGGLLDQSAYFTEAMEVIDNTLSRLRNVQ